MIHTFEDFFLYAYVIIDDIWKGLEPRFSHPGPRPKCSDSELITIALVSECRGWDTESELLSRWKPYLDLFPNFPERSRFNRRRRHLAGAWTEPARMPQLRNDATTRSAALSREPRCPRSDTRRCLSILLVTVSS